MEAVRNDINIHGPKSFAIPGLIEGTRIAFENFATLSWEELLKPAIDLARRGPIVDWYTSLMITGSAKFLNRYGSSKNRYFEDGFPISTHWTGGNVTRLDFTSLSYTLESLSKNGPREFYDGRLARKIISDIQAVGGDIQLSDFNNYKTRLADAGTIAYGNTEINFAPGLTAGSSFAEALTIIARLKSNKNKEQNSLNYCQYADTLNKVY